MPLLRAAILEESVFDLNSETTFSSFSISSLYLCRVFSAFDLIASSFDLAESSICSLSFLIELAFVRSSSFAFSSRFHLACDS